MVETSLVVFSVNVLIALLRKYVFPKWGRMGVQVVAFVLALIGALYMTYNGAFPAIKILVTQGLSVFAMAIAFYEVVLKQIPLFRKR